MTKILVIEDDKNIRANLLDILAMEGYEPTAAPNGRQGLQLAQDEDPDLILCDLAIPELNGYEVLRALRQNGDLSTIPFIFLTAKVEKEYFRQGMELGADDYLTKPFTLSELLGAIKTQLSKRDRLRKAEDRIDYLLHYDPLVQLPNKRSLQKWLQKRQIESSTVAMGVLVLDRFDRLQQTWPHHVIVEILQAVTGRLQCDRSDSIYLAYFNLNQFVFFLDNDEICSFASRVLDNFYRPFFCRDREVLLTASLGIAVSDRDPWDLDELFERAEIAKNHALQLGGNQYQCYTPTLAFHSLEYSFLETSLSHALERHELQVYYQPQISLETGEIIGMEALMRWFHPQKGLISPVQFIPIAEEFGWIIEMGEWILKTACLQVKHWQEKYHTNLALAVNLSVRQLNDDQFCDRLRKILQETQFPPHCLELELTESILVENIELTHQKINALKSLGIAIAIDDFGTGYGSLSYLQQFSFDIVKIDRGFIRDLDSNTTNAAIVTTIVEMAKRLNCRAIAEGVSTQADLNFLKEHHCYAVQGYFFSPPLPPTEFTALLDEGSVFVKPV